MMLTLVRLPKPKLSHPPEIYAAIVQNHRADPVRLAQTLQALGWSLADAAWASVNWSSEWMAAAIAAEKEGRKMKLHMLSEDALSKLRADLAAGNRPPAARRTTRIIRTRKDNEHGKND